MGFKKAPINKVKTSFNFDKLSSTQIMIYLELSTKVLNELQEESYHILNCDFIGEIPKEDGNILDKKVTKLANVYTGAHQALTEEMSRRFKRDMKIGIGPADIQKIHHRWATDYPGLSISKQDAYDRAIDKKKKMREYEAKEKSKKKTSKKKVRNLTPKTK